MAFQPGDRIGGYEITGVLGAGGMGQVYRVQNVLSERVEAMKVLLPNLAAEPELADRFTREMRLQARMQHPNIANLNTAFQHENQLVMVMELVEGVSLDKKLARGRLSVPETIGYARQILQALSYAHQRGVVHRDIKPSNIMITPEGVVKLLDFGIAKAADDRKLTKTGMAVGSIYYMSPEQIQGQDSGPQSDLYAVGIVLYQCVTGRRPIDGESEFSIMSAHLNAKVVPPVAVDRSIPPEVSGAILKALEKEPARRFQSAEELLRAFEAKPAPEPPPRRDETTTMPQGSAIARRRSLVLPAAVLAGLVALGLAAVQVPKWFSHAPPVKLPPEIASVLQAGTTRVNPKDGLTYVWIPPGKFMMGCSQDDTECRDNEKPAHEVNIAKGFWLGQTEVTQAAWKRVIGNDPSYFKGADRPVEKINLDEAKKYCEAIGGRLPTEAEWEYAARAGSRAARYRDIDRIAWYDKNSGNQTHDVKQREPNA